MAREHSISIVGDGKQVIGWTEYQIDTSLLDPADTWSLTLPVTKDIATVVASLRCDRFVRVAIDDVPRIAGYVDEAGGDEAEGTFSVNGRCKIGRLVQTSAPGVNYEGLTLFGFLGELAKPEFAKVTPSNARNRRLLRGKGHHAASRDAVYLDQRSSKRIEPGRMRWDLMEELAVQAGYSMWSSGDGEELVVAQPDYSQGVQYHFFAAAPGSSRARETNVKNLQPHWSTADAYSKIVVVGSGAGTDANYGLSVASRAGEWKDNPATANGEGRAFSIPKVLVVADHDVASAADAKRKAAREAARRNLRRELITVTAPLHGQRVAGSKDLTLFAPDTLAFLESETYGIKGPYLVVSCSYRSTKDAGEHTVMELLPKGTVIAA